MEMRGAHCAVKSPALATRTLTTSATPTTTTNAISNRHYKMKLYSFKRTGPVTVHATWSGESLSMDDIVDHVQGLGHGEVIDWVTSGSRNRVILEVDGLGPATKLTHEAPHHIMGRSTRKVVVQFEMA